MALMLLHRVSDPVRHICIEGWQQKAGDLFELQELLWPADGRGVGFSLARSRAAQENGVRNHSIDHGASASRGTAILVEGESFRPR